MYNKKTYRKYENVNYNQEKKEPTKSGNMKFQDLEEKLDIISENIWTSQQKNGNYKKKKRKF